MTAVEAVQRGTRGLRAPADLLRGERSLPFEWIAPLICLIFGILCLIFVVGPGDGTWILYAREMEAGQRIYSDLGLNQQPLFALVSLAALKISPGGILGDKMLFLVVIGVHVLLIWLVSRRAAGPGLPAIALTLATYFTAIHFEAFRYDDYHATAECLVLASLYVSLRYADGEVKPNWFAVAQSALAAGAFLTRVNEGLAIAGAVSGFLLWLHGPSRLTARLLVMCALGAPAVIAFVLLLVGETPATWFHQTLVAASEAKGGINLLAAPWRAVLDAANVLLRPPSIALVLAVGMACFAIFRAPVRSSRDAYLLGGTAGACIFAALVLCYPPDPLMPLTALVLLAGALGWLLWAIRGLTSFPRSERAGANAVLGLAAYPFFMFATGSLSTGGKVLGLFFPLALSLVVGAALLRKPLLQESRSALRVACYSFLAPIAVFGFFYRAADPYSWLTYRVNPFFVDYELKNDRHNGPHVITRELAELVTPVCVRTQSKSLLSLPFSFANYYCGVPVWHGYIQTFFDTSTKSRIEQLERELEQAPPDFIFYQRQLPILRLHERIFAGGGRLPQRDLDELIVRKVRSREWTIVDRSTAYRPSTWYLISTRAERGSSRSPS